MGKGGKNLLKSMILLTVVVGLIVLVWPNLLATATSLFVMLMSVVSVGTRIFVAFGIMLIILSLPMLEAGVAMIPYKESKAPRAYKYLGWLLGSIILAIVYVHLVRLLILADVGGLLDATHLRELVQDGPAEGFWVYYLITYIASWFSILEET